MRRTILTTCFTLVCAAALFAGQATPQSQSDQSTSTTQQSTTTSRTTTETHTASRGAVTLTGCLQAGTEPNTFVLNNATETRAQASTKGSRRKGMASETNPSEMARTDTSYLLVPANKKMDLSQHIGQRVEVKGSLMSGHGKAGVHTSSSTTSSTTESSSSTGSATADKSATAGTMGSMGQMELRVRSIRQVSATCP